MFEYILTGVVSALATCVPLYISLRNTASALKAQNAELIIKIKRENQSVEQQGKIDTEASWKRIMDEKDKELNLLRARDDEQESKIDNLLTRHIECMKNEARQEERSKYLTDRCDKQEGEIKVLTRKILQLESLLRKHDNVDGQSGSGSFRTLNSQRLDAEEKVGE